MENENDFDFSSVKLCCRIRPLLEHEKEQNFYETTIANENKVHFFEPKLSLK